MVAVRPRGRETWTYGDLLRRVALTAAGLAGAGIRPGDRVLIRMPDVPETAVQLAVWRLGGIVVPSSVLEAAGELRFMLNDTEAAAVVCSSAHATELEKALPDTPTVQHVVGWPAPVAGGPSLDEICENQPEVFKPYPTLPLRHLGDLLHRRHDRPAEGVPAHACGRGRPGGPEQRCARGRAGFRLPHPRTDRPRVRQWGEDQLPAACRRDSGLPGSALPRRTCGLPLPNSGSPRWPAPRRCTG